MLSIAYEMSVDIFSKQFPADTKKQWLIDELEDIYKNIYEKY